MAAVGTFVWMYAVSYADGWVGRLSPIDPATFYRVFLEPRTSILLKQLLISVGLLLMASAAFATRRFAAVMSLFGGMVVVTAVVLLA